MIFPGMEKNRKEPCFHDKKRLNLPVAAVSASLILHALVVAYLILIPRDATTIKPQHYSTAWQLISVSLINNKEDISTPPMTGHVDSLQPGKISGRKDTPEPLSSNVGIDVRTKTDAMKSIPLMEENTNSTHGTETTYAIFADTTPSSVAYENLLDGKKDHQNITKSSDSSAQIMPRYLNTPKPPYPLNARIKGYNGVVFLRVEVLKSGRVSHISIIKSSGYDILDRAALDTVTRWQFEPGRDNGKIQDMIIDIPVRFSLND